MLGTLKVWIERLLASGRCPTEQQLAEYADQQAIGPERHAIERHLAHCDKCLRQVGFLVREGSRPTELVPEELVAKAIALGKQSARKTAFPWQWATVAAAGVSVVLLVMLWTPRFNQPARTIEQQPSAAQPPVIAQTAKPPLPNAETGARIVRGNNDVPDSRLLSPRPGQTVDAQELTLRWQSVAGVLFYEVQVLSDAGDILWETRCHSTSIKMPPNVHLIKGKTYYARLRVHTANGSVEQSKPVDFVAG